MKWFWSKYKTGFLIVLLPIIVTAVLAKVIDWVWGIAVVLHSWSGGPVWLRYILFVLLVLLPFGAGWLAARRFFISLVRKTFSLFGAGWLANSLFKDEYLEKIKSGDYQVAIFEVFPGDNPSLKIGAVVNTFKLKGVEYCLILEMTPPLPAGPFWIKRKSDLTFLAPEFVLKHLLMTTFSLGLNFPMEDKPPPQL